MKSGADRPVSAQTTGPGQIRAGWLRVTLTVTMAAASCSGMIASVAAQEASAPAKAALGDKDRPRRIYLDEFRPKPALKTELHPLEQAKFPCVNVHFHPGKLTPEELDEAVRVMDQANIAVSISLDGKVGPKFSEHAQFLNSRHPNRFLTFVRMDYIGDGNPDDQSTWDVNQPGYGQRMADKLSDAVKQGAKGLKLLKDLGLTIRDREGKIIPVDDPRFDPVWQRAAELKIPVLWHCADPRSFFNPSDETNERWEELYRHPEWSFHGGDFPKFDELVAARMKVVGKHPETTFISAHFADLPDDLKTLGKYLDQHPNLMIEFAGRIAELGRQPYSAREFFLTYCDRILFGTDGVPPMSELVPHFQMLETRDEYFPYEDNPFPPQGLWNIYGLDLPDDVLRQVYFENARRVIPGLKEALDAYVAAHPKFDRIIKGTPASPARWEPTMKRFDADNAARNYPPGGVVFFGSSSMVQWKLETNFPGKGYINRGFGGSDTAEALHHTRRVLLPLKPKVVLIYEGDNDLPKGKSPERVADDTRKILKIIRTELPEARIIVLSVKYCPSRAKFRLQQQAANALLELICSEVPQCEYVNVAATLLDAQGQPEPKYFVKDMLHLSPEGYEKWSAAVAPAIERALQAPAVSQPAR